MDRSGDETVDYIRARKLGGKIAEACDITRQAVSLWRQVPPEHVVSVSKVVRFAPHRIRPDVFPPPRIMHKLEKFRPADMR